MTSRKIVFWEVDAQRDFMLPGGKLYVPGAEKIIPNIKRLVDAASHSGTFLVSSGCSHSDNDPEFQAFPPHCIRGTSGAEIIPEGMTERFCTIPNDPSLSLPSDFSRFQQIVFEKQELDVFSNPHAGTLVDQLEGDAEYALFGVVTEYCVLMAAKGLIERGRNVSIVKDAIETLSPEDGRRTLDELQGLGVRLISTDEAIAAARDAASGGPLKNAK